MTLGREPLVSVVTPVYNGEHYLRECIESVLAQTYANWDYCIVNNCSTDRTLEIAQEYSAKDPRIRILNNDAFIGVNENHNVAFRQISPQSKYCKVVAADDWIFPECLQKMVGLAEAHPGVAIVGAYGLLGTKLVWDGLPYTSTVMPGREFCRSSMMGAPALVGGPTSVLFRSDIVRSRYAFYNEANFHADAEAICEFLEHHDFGFVHQVLTFRRVHEGSLTSYSKRVNTYLAGYLDLLIRYGPKYFSDEELKYLLRGQLRAYYRYLGEQVYRRRGREFWTFHQGKLAELGYPLSKSRLAASAMLYALNLVLDPRRTAAAVVHQLRRVLSRSTE
jgi:glycosyltransferase involved in cell wall biosynthesis